MDRSYDRQTKRTSSLGKDGTGKRALEQDPLSLGLPNHHRLIGESDSIRRIEHAVALAAPTLCTVLIQGESGTGKEIIANTLHSLSPRRARPFVVFNCGEFSEGLIESELFGHRKGAFTSSHADKKGLFDEADGGTIFLDEIGEMPPSHQVKLLRALQERQIRPVGATSTHRIDVRVIAATNRDLDVEVLAGRFRFDLLQRIKQVTIVVPPLRDRGDDIQILIQYFLRKVFPDVGLSQPAQIAPDALALLCSYPWPGNVRELENKLTGLSLWSQETGVITLEMVKRELGDFTSTGSTSIVDMTEWTLDDFILYQNRELLAFLMGSIHRMNGDKAAAADALHMGVHALYKKLNRLSAQVL